MESDISLWTTVVIAHLPVPQTCRQIHKIDLEAGYERIDDVKVKTRHCQVKRQSKYLEASIEIEIIVLYEDEHGSTRIFCCPLIIKERSDWPSTDRKSATSDVRYVLQLLDLHWDTALVGDELLIEITASYMINAVKEQIVKINSQSEAQKERQMVIHGSQKEDIVRIQSENEALVRRLGCYQKDVLSLKHGIRKAEERNAQLHKELDQTRERVQQLQEAISHKELLISRYMLKTSPRPSPLNPNRSSDGDIKIGQRLKRLLLSCF